jgi:hypothetical protein
MGTRGGEGGRDIPRAREKEELAVTDIGVNAGTVNGNCRPFVKSVLEQALKPHVNTGGQTLEGVLQALKPRVNT